MATIKENKTNASDITGEKALMLQSGTIIKVKNGSPLGEILIKTDSNKYPFVTLSNGEVWGNNMNDYLFEILEYSIELSN